MTNEQKASRLLPCPFCGDEARVFYVDRRGTDFYGVECINENCPIGAITDVDCRRTSRDEAISAWNNRAEPQAMGVDVEDLVTKLEEEGIDLYYDDFAINERGKEMLRQHLASAKGVGEGYVVVPREPTDAMVESGFGMADYEDRNSIKLIWREMLKAAPTTEKKL